MEQELSWPRGCTERPCIFYSLSWSCCLAAFASLSFLSLCDVVGAEVVSSSTSMGSFCAWSCAEGLSSSPLSCQGEALWGSAVSKKQSCHSSQRVTLTWGKEMFVPGISHALGKAGRVASSCSSSAWGVIPHFLRSQSTVRIVP